MDKSKKDTNKYEPFNILLFDIVTNYNEMNIGLLKKYLISTIIDKDEYDEIFRYYKNYPTETKMKQVPKNIDQSKIKNKYFSKFRNDILDFAQSNKIDCFTEHISSYIGLIIKEQILNKNILENIKNKIPSFKYVFINSQKMIESIKKITTISYLRNCFNYIISISDQFINKNFIIFDQSSSFYKHINLIYNDSIKEVEKRELNTWIKIRSDSLEEEWNDMYKNDTADIPKWKYISEILKEEENENEPNEIEEVNDFDWIDNLIRIQKILPTHRNRTNKSIEVFEFFMENQKKIILNLKFKLYLWKDKSNANKIKDLLESFNITSKLIEKNEYIEDEESQWSWNRANETNGKQWDNLFNKVKNKIVFKSEIRNENWRITYKKTK